MNNMHALFFIYILAGYGDQLVLRSYNSFFFKLKIKKINFEFNKIMNLIKVNFESIKIFK